MKRCSFFSFLFLLAICFSACDKGNTEQNVADEYYVKYEMNSSSLPYTGGTQSITINAENNKEMNFVINTGTPWETVIGPVKKGFNAQLMLS